MIDYLLLRHLSVGRDLRFLNHPSQHIVLLPQSVDLGAQFVTDRLDKSFGVALYDLHLASNGVVLSLQLLQRLDGPVHVIFVAVALRNKGDLARIFGKIDIHND
jgi:hypothetical protein